MSERHFRIVLGLWLVGALYLNSVPLVQALLVLLLFEGITNLRIPRLLTRLRPVAADVEIQPAAARFSFEAERMLRLIVAALVALPMLESAQALWWLPWVVGFALIGAGLSGICPMVMALRRVGLR
ncbi:DUF2892 domain-containing protein [Thiohalobacter thiocyanaticus]|uniref:DUF2892 domain-containing protein n=1 Tax=Thiohalobacter thiocyanaticus TaxID=585455 RepID=A0A426QGT2_9GAMM|nr:DUF2892 domain-containing protein [Thiohalobacter thiocyanaticus]RRQ20965.1 DUF2892 domain-containing protein [Thiohalobacter thiocyanaticus]